ncbi:hypothetical protein F511_42862 [Dorcoceras hygrometricum]|uniref:Uncharacterized protein n=1 Tax=Dorcoceras hygrometricum TaxID=472368 RepID=A0A2Z7AEZ9_9LAMI|nr:hypothetical protein F511_42862 [Dorcoceras hygrometricum]
MKSGKQVSLVDLRSSISLIVISAVFNCPPTKSSNLHLHFHDKTHLNGKNFVSNGFNSNRGYICEGNAIEEQRRLMIVVAHKRENQKETTTKGKNTGR